MGKYGVKCFHMFPEVIPMPALYTHYRFGAQCLPAITGDAAKAIARFRKLYDAGTQGPDPFFYYDPLFRSGATALGHTLHQQTGMEFFSRLSKIWKGAPTERGLAYLHGMLTHYALDSVCHPVIVETARTTNMGHSEMEVEFDRFLLAKDGRKSPCTCDLSGIIRLTREEARAIAAFFPEASPIAVNRSFWNMAAATRLLASKNRRAIECVFRLAGPGNAQMVMHRHPNQNCMRMNEPLQLLYEKAQVRYTVLARQLNAHLKENTPFGEEYRPQFG